MTGGTITTLAGGFLQIDADSRLGASALTLNGGGIKYGAAFDDLRSFTLGSSGGTLDTNGFNVTTARPSRPAPAASRKPAPACSRSMTPVPTSAQPRSMPAL